MLIRPVFSGLVTFNTYMCIYTETNTNSETSCNENMIISCSGSDDAHYFPWRINEESCEVAGMNRTLLFQTKSGNFSLIFNTDTIIKCEIQSNPSGALNIYVRIYSKIHDIHIIFTC